MSNCSSSVHLEDITWYVECSVIPGISTDAIVNVFFLNFTVQLAIY